MTSVAARDTVERNELSWEFLMSEFARDNYGNWPIERRLDAYLRHHELVDVLNGGAAYGTTNWWMSSTAAPPTAGSWIASWPISGRRIDGASWGPAHLKRTTLHRVPRRRLADD